MRRAESLVGAREEFREQAIAAHGHGRARGGEYARVGRGHEGQESGHRNDGSRTAHGMARRVGNGCQRAGEGLWVKNADGHENGEHVKRVDHPIGQKHAQRNIPARIAHLLGHAGHFGQSAVGNENHAGHGEGGLIAVGRERLETGGLHAGQAQHNVGDDDGKQPHDQK